MSTATIGYHQVVGDAIASMESLTLSPSKRGVEVFYEGAAGGGKTYQNRLQHMAKSWTRSDVTNTRKQAENANDKRRVANKAARKARRK